MPRDRKSRQWVKLDCEGMLRGSINYLFLVESDGDMDANLVESLACQAIWVKMIAFSEVCGGRPGHIEVVTMPRDRKSRQWVKLDCEGMLRGSINYLFLEENDGDMDENLVVSLACQAIWVKMIAFSEVCGGRPGHIEDNNGNGLPHQYIASELHCPVRLFKMVLDKMVNDEAVIVNGTGSIELVNFKHYQYSEYDRQKVYRQKTGDGTQTFEEYVEAIKPEYVDLDVDAELKKFELWWSEGKKELKRPKSAFRNWLDKARQIKAENEAKKNPPKKKSKFGDGW